MDENNFNNGLDDLLNMFKKMMENQDLDAIPGINEEQKDPFTKQMVGMVMGQLKNFPGMFPGMEMPAQNAAPQAPTVNKEKQLTDIPGTTENLEAHLAEIDKQLRNPDLSEEDMNRLLDERSAIINDLKI